MNQSLKTVLLFALVAGLILFTGFYQSWNTALVILNMGLVSAIMALGVNLQWGIAGLFNVGVMGFVALGGLAVVLTSVSPVPEAWAAGGPRALLALVVGTAVIAVSAMLWKRSRKGWLVALVLIGGFFLYRWVRDDAVNAIEAVNPAGTGFLGGLGLPVVLAWPMGGLLAAGAAWVIGKTALGLRSDYLAIATLGISEIIIAIMKNEEWLSRGVKNVNGLPRPVPYETDLQADPAFVEQAAGLGLDPATASTIYVKLGYSLMFAAVLVVLLVLAQLALKSPWGRMMRAIRDNEVSARAMGKDVTYRHLQVFVLGSAICGIAGAMMTTLDGQLTPTTYQPLRYTFLIWVMVIVGGSGNNLGAVLGGMLIWFFWVQVEPLGQSLMSLLTAGMADGSWLKAHLLDSVQHMRLLTMGVILLLVLRFSPRGLLPER
ncbi:branched-chain amino acid ABC transporter permease [Sagittula sp. MA-2]|jgi:branched-chain amino acid transport system permease protein|uniref:branched-chain amino acid ABC transporter permease n=1 Tax=Sagittula sp. MA-2 TaxID=3048007 RepID=UPI0024C2C64A|nr:branched-chain amino acid ABC transporter permease [Sagittula sp. MA-2]WHZ37287.1 branched-chain amino acid ABC transporter permease [Sagittula sp. MA-2]